MATSVQTPHPMATSVQIPHSMTTSINIEQRVERARELFMSGYNCSQAVFMALADLYDIPEQQSARLSASFGGGVGRLREMCGACSAMVMLEGLQSGATQAEDAAGKQANYKNVQALVHRFAEQNGSYLCRELLQLRKDAPTPPTPDARTAEYYRQRPCLRMVESATRIYCERLQGALGN